MEKIIKMLGDAVKSINIEEKSLVNIVSSADIDRDNDIIVPENIVDVNYAKNPVVLFQHNSNQVIGKSLWRKVDGKNFISKTQFANTILANEIWSLYKDAFMNSFSIGFFPIEETHYREDGVRLFGSVEMLEYSGVSIPANPMAVTLDFVKSLESPELSDIFFKNYIVQNLEKEIEELQTTNIDLGVHLLESNQRLEILENKYLAINIKVDEMLIDSNKIKSEEQAKRFINDVSKEIQKKLNIKI